MEKNSPNQPSTASRLLPSLLSACAAVAIAWGLIHTLHPAFHVPKEFHINVMGAPKEQTDRFIAKQREVDRKNAMLVMTFVGAALGAAIAFGKSTTAFPIRIVIGILAGAVIGVTAGLLGSIAHAKLTPQIDEPSITDTVNVQMAMLGVLGIGLGMVKGLFEKSGAAIVGGLLAGVIAGVLAGVAYPILASFVPSASTAALIPDETVTRLLWLSSAAVLFSIVIPMGVQKTRPIDKGDETIRKTSSKKVDDTISTE